MSPLSFPKTRKERLFLQKVRYFRLSDYVLQFIVHSPSNKRSGTQSPGMNRRWTINIGKRYPCCRSRSPPMLMLPISSPISKPCPQRDSSSMARIAEEPTSSSQSDPEPRRSPSWSAEPTRLPASKPTTVEGESGGWKIQHFREKGVYVKTSQRGACRSHTRSPRSREKPRKINVFIRKLSTKRDVQSLTKTTENGPSTSIGYGWNIMGALVGLSISVILLRNTLLDSPGFCGTFTSWPLCCHTPLFSLDRMGRTTLSRKDPKFSARTDCLCLCWQSFFSGALSLLLGLRAIDPPNIIVSLCTSGLWLRYHHFGSSGGDLCFMVAAEFYHYPFGDRLGQRHLFFMDLGDIPSLLWRFWDRIRDYLGSSVENHILFCSLKALRGSSCVTADSLFLLTLFFPVALEGLIRQSCLKMHGI